MHNESIPQIPQTVEPWIRQAQRIGMKGNDLRCPGCGALIAYYFQGWALKRCWRCRENYTLTIIRKIQMEVVAPLNRIYADESYGVGCPMCGAPLMEYLIGVYTIVCYYCKWGGIIHRNAVSLIQSSHILVEPKWKNTVWQPGKPASEEALRE